MTPTDPTVSLEESLVNYGATGIVPSLPNTDEFNINFDRKGSLERRTLAPTSLILAGVHFIGKRDLLVVVLREKSDLNNQSQISRRDSRKVGA